MCDWRGSIYWGFDVMRQLVLKARASGMLEEGQGEGQAEGGVVTSKMVRELQVRSSADADE